MTNYLAPPKPARINLIDILLIVVPVTVVLVYFITGPVIGSWSKQRTANAQGDAELLGLAAIQYQQDHGGHLPPANRWETALRPYVLIDPQTSMEKILRPPAPYWEAPRRFAFNRALGGKNLNATSSACNVILFYESTLPGPDAADDLATPAATDTGDIVVVHQDGWVEDVDTNRVASLFTASHQEEAKLR